MNAEVSYSLRTDALNALRGRLTGYSFNPDYTVSLLSAGTELSGNGYARAEVAVGSLRAATWSRSGTTVTVTVSGGHNLATGDSIDAENSSDAAAVPSGTYAITVTGATTFTITGVNTGATSGTLDYSGAGFWDADGDGERGWLLQARDIVFPAASGADWLFDELRIHSQGATGDWLFRFQAASSFTVNDGDTLTIPAGTLRMDDNSPDVGS